ncbi:MAG: HAD family hydrolase [Solobacterium sp.]|nr:HAD family hydrolase [Solobacterium sp.]
MTKAVFLDYKGTIIRRKGKDLEEFHDRILRGSRMSDEAALSEWWMTNRGIMETTCSGESFLSQEEICVALLHRMEKDYGLRENIDELKQLMMNHWMYAPVFSDVREFFEQCSLPIYILTNINEQYVRVCLRRNGLHVNAVISGESVKAYKPDPRLFEKALQISECSAEDAVCIGSSLSADITAAEACGIRGVLLNRQREAIECSCKMVYKLSEAIRYL